ncbi:PKD domain-containing protein [Halorussus salilacus]|uniref:PKD domain-containing protein n=1 Tax=Halorussus salilacus TaxID=2953750 RepID=UPI0020A14BF6|nr:PKD domain-containing protein [Halorussus salilacus]USZ69232.1 PKD domain-containing protein [Halorussus salilacus]
MTGRSLRTGFTAMIALLLVTTPVAGVASVSDAGGMSEARQSLDRTPAATDGDAASRPETGARILNTQQETGARILNTQHATGSFEEGEEVTTEVEVENTGYSTHTFFVGYGVKGPDGERYNNDEETGKTVTLEPDEREWVTVSWRVEDDAPTGTYDSEVAVWKESDRDDLNTRLAGSLLSDAFEVVEPPNQPPSADIQCTDSEVEVGEDITCAADRSTDDDGTITSYEWDFGGRASESGEVASHSFSESGDYTVEVTVTDDEGATDTAWMTIHVEDVEEPPSADISCTPTEATTDDTVECSAADSTDPDGTLDSFEWDFGDGHSDDGEWTAHRFDDPGSYTVELEVTDDDGLSDTATETVDIEEVNEPPSADISCTPTEATTDDTVECSAADSTDPDGTLDSFEWDFGDGHSGDGEWTTHRFDDPGSYTVELEVTDDDGLTDTVTETVDVEEVNEPPSADISCTPTEATTDDTVECSAAGSIDEDGTLSAFDWQLGDGTTDDGEYVTHTFEESGTYTVELAVTDDDGMTDTVTETVDVEEVEEPPTAAVSCTPSEVTVGESVECSAADATDPDGRIETFDWAFEDGSSGYGERVDHTFDEPGTYTVELAVIDDDGLSASATEEVTVIEDNEGPTADISYSPSDLERGDTVRLDASDSTDPDGEVDGYEWRLGDDVKYGETVEYALDDTGSHTVELVVTDDDGATDTATQSLSVQRRPTAAFDVSPEQPNSGHGVSFEAEQDSRIERYEWDFDGDGEYEATGRKATHRFDSSGKSPVELHVVGKDGIENTATEIVTVQQNAYFQLTADRATVEGDSGTTVVQFSASNHVNDERLQVKLELDLPDESVSIESVAGESPASRKSTGFFDVGPGEDKSFRVRLQVNEPGTYDVGGRAVYYYGDQEDRRDRDVGPITVGTEADGADAEAQDEDENEDEDEGDRDSSETRTDDVTTDDVPGFGPIVTAAGVILAVWIGRRRR